MLARMLLIVPCSFLKDAITVDMSYMIIVIDGIAMSVSKNLSKQMVVIFALVPMNVQ